MNRLGCLGKDERWSPLLVAGLERGLGRLEAESSGGCVPGEAGLLGDQEVGATVAVEVDEAQVGVRPVDVGVRLERYEVLPSLVVCPLEEPRRGRAELDQGLVAAALQVHQLLACAGELSRDRLGGDEVR